MAQTPAQTLAKLKAAQAKMVKDVAALEAANPRPVALTDAQYDRKQQALAADVAAKQKAKDDAAANAAATAASINAMGITGLSSKVNEKTGMVETTKPVIPKTKKLHEGEAGYHLNPLTGEWEKNADGGDDLPEVFEFVGKFLNFGGKPFTGEYGGSTYKNGIKQSTKEELDAAQALAAAEEEKKNLKRDAFKLIESTMSAYGFLPDEWEELNTYIQGALINPKIGPNQALLEMRNLNVYKKRFAGNTARVNAGLNALSESEYLIQEDAYSQTFRAYGLQNMNSRSQFATLMGNDISNIELGKRVGMAVDRVQKADPKILATLNQYYGSINDKDLISYFLNPKEALPELQKKVTVGEIGAAAAQFGLVNKEGLSNVSRVRAEEFAGLGITQETARAGYESISEKLQRGQQLSDISKEDNINYDQNLAEDATIKGLASAKRAEAKLTDKEKGRFGGASGTNQYTLKKSTLGSF